MPGARPPAADSPEPGPPAGLTSRELDVLRLLAVGQTSKQIGTELFISPRTVGVHVSHILDKLGAASGRRRAGWVLAGCWLGGAGAAVARVVRVGA